MIDSIMTRDDLRFSEHAGDRMAEEGVIVDDVLVAIDQGEVIETYPNDRPFPSQLSFAMSANRPVHVVWATDPDAAKIVVITAYVLMPAVGNLAFGSGGAIYEMPALPDRSNRSGHESVHARAREHAAHRAARTRGGVHDMWCRGLRC